MHSPAWKIEKDPYEVKYHVRSQCGWGGRGKIEHSIFFNPSLTNSKLIAWAPSLTHLHLCVYMFTCVSTFPGCSAGYASLFSRLCYPVQQAMLPCSAGYATLFSRLFPIYPATRPMLSLAQLNSSLFHYCF